MKACPLCGRVTDASDGKCEADGADLAPFEPAVPEGEIVAGTYRILRPIGAGPSGETYEASEEPGGDRAIVKLLSDDVSKDKRLADQIRRQVFRQKEFAHRFVARVRAVDVRGERLVVVRDMVAGRRLGDIMAAEGGLAVERALALAGRICEALGEAHKLGILHLQIRPSNVFVVPGVAGAPEEPRLVDFGIGPRVKIGGKPFFGVPAYLAPEQIEGKIVSFRVDIFSLGVLLYHMIEGRPPFVGDDVAVVDALVNAPEPPIRADSADPQILAVRTLLGQLLQKKPIHRPIGMSHVCDRIREIQAISSGKAGAPAEAARHAPPPPPAKAAIARIALRQREVRLDGSAAPADAAPGVESSRPGAAAPVEIHDLPGPSAADAPISIDVDVDATVEPPPARRQEVAPAYEDLAPPPATPAVPTPHPPSPPAAARVEAGPDVRPPEEHGEAPPSSSATIPMEPEILEEFAIPPPLGKPPPAPARPPDPTAASYRRGLGHGLCAGIGVAIIGVLATVIVMRLGPGAAPDSVSAPPAPQPAAEGPRIAMVAEGPMQVTPIVPDPGDPAPSGTADSPTASPEDASAAGAPDAATPPQPDAGEGADVRVPAATDVAPADAGEDPGAIREVAAIVRPDAGAAPPPGGAPDAGREVAAEARGTAPVGPRAVDAATPRAEAASTGPGDVERANALVDEGNRLLAARDFDGAAAAFGEARRLDPRNRRAPIGLGRVAFQQQNFEEAVRLLEPAVGRQGNMELGMAYMRVGRTADAKRQFEMLLERNPSNADAQRALDAVRRQLGE